MLMYGRNQINTVKQSSFNSKLKKTPAAKKQVNRKERYTGSPAAVSLERQSTNPRSSVPRRDAKDSQTEWSSLI